MIEEKIKSLFKGTKWPWALDPKISTVIRSCDGRGVANVSVYTSNTATLDIDAENEANAKLIAAAPELLALSEKLRECIANGITTTDIKFLDLQASRAITKALS